MLFIILPAIAYNSPVQQCRNGYPHRASFRIVSGIYITAAEANAAFAQKEDHMRKRTLFLLFVFMGVTACASSRYAVVDMPLRDAGLYPLSHTYADFSIAIDEFSNPDRSMRYFGADLIGSGILPVDVLMRKGNKVIDPLPGSIVTELIKSEESYNKETRKLIENHIAELMLKETVVFPRDNQRGVLFFPVLEQRAQHEYFSRIPLFTEGLKLHVMATNMDTGERKMFGPYSITLDMKVW
jgi:hypothetical protein